MTKLTIKNNIKDTQETVHETGNFYIGNGNIFILSIVDNNTKVALISVSGNRWSTPQYVENNFSITQEEFDLIADGDKFTLLNSVTITIE